VASNDSKQKRARQNRAQREAREARTKAAAIPAEQRKAKYASGTTEEASKKKDRPERARRERPVRLGDTPVDLDTLEGSWYRKRVAVPGGRQVLTGMVLTIIITAMTVLVKYPDPDAKTEAAKKKLDHTFTEVWGPKGWVFIAIPFIAMAVACWAITSPNRRRIWNICAFVAAIGIIFGIPYAFPVGFLVYAGMRANKIEGPVPGSRAARMIAAREQAAGAADDVDGQ
jgi:hypothetical protein